MGIDPDSIQLKENDDLASRGSELIDRFVKGYLRAVFIRVPEEMIRYMKPDLILMIQQFHITFPLAILELYMVT